MVNRVLVYGTLRPGIHEPVKVPGRMYQVGWFPGVILDAESEETFVCEPVEVSDDVLRGLYRYDDYNPQSPEHSLFRRVEHDGAFIYVYNQSVDGYEQVVGGDWLAHTGENGGRNNHLLGLSQVA